MWLWGREGGAVEGNDGKGQKVSVGKQECILDSNVVRFRALLSSVLEIRSEGTYEYSHHGRESLGKRMVQQLA